MSEKGRVKFLVAYLIVLSLIFAGQSYFLYFEYIPKVLAPFANNNDVHAHLERVLYTLARFIRIWFLVLAGSITGLIIGLYVTAKKNAKK